MIQEIFKDIYQIKIPLPGNPLKALNSYLIKGKKKCLLVDTGFNWPECKEAQMQGMAALGLEWSEIDFFITHMHADHSGLVYKLADKDSKVYCSRIDADLIRDTATPAYRKLSDNFYMQNGYPPKAIANKSDNPREWISGTDIDFTCIEDGDVLKVGGYCLQCVATPGHSPGHMCLYDARHKILIGGDHILGSITPNITCWRGVDDPLGDYLSSLDKIDAMEIKTILPGHREIIRDHHRRIKELKQHHEERMREIIVILKMGPMNAYQVASYMHWELSYDAFEQFPDYQQWFATGEAIAHLQHMAKLGQIECIRKEDKILYQTIMHKQVTCATA